MGISEKKLLKEIRSGKNVKKHLLDYSGEFLSCYYEEALILSAYREYTFCEMLMEQREKTAPEGQGALEEMERLWSCIAESAKCLGKEAVQASELAAVGERLCEMRQDIQRRLDAVTVYVDSLSIYEYVLNRMEMKYGELILADEEFFVKRLAQYLMRSGDSAVVNDTIKEVLGQLPVRMTRQHFFDLIRQSLDLYQGSDREAADGYLYLLRTSAMLYHPEEEATCFPECFEWIEQLRRLDFSNMPKEQYDLCVKRLSSFAAALEERTNYYMAAAEAINSLYTCAEARLELETADEWRELGEMLKKEDYVIQAGKIFARLGTSLPRQPELLLEELSAPLEALEGRQENLEKRLQSVDGLLYELKEVMPKERYQRFDRMQRLMTVSLFTELFEEEISKKKADAAYLEKAGRELFKEWNEQFLKHPKQVNRAIMANTLKNMPVFFQSLQEVCDYVQGALEQCHDLPEKYGSIQILNDIMESL